MYISDYDEHLPYAIDAGTRAEENVVATDLDLTIVNRMPLFVQTVLPYLRSTAVFQCPSEHPIGIESDTYFNDFQKYGSSYEYAIYPAYMNWTIEDFDTPAAQYPTWY